VPKVGEVGLQRFLEGVHARLQKGAIEYGNESFGRSTTGLVQEVLAEQLDTAGWLFVLWVQARNRQKRVDLTAGVRARYQLQFLTAVGTWIELGIMLDDDPGEMATTGAICDELTKLAAGAFFTWQALEKRLDHAINKLLAITTSNGHRLPDFIGKRGGTRD
jgi:hypothetical protein